MYFLFWRCGGGCDGWGRATGGDVGAGSARFGPATQRCRRGHGHRAGRGTSPRTALFALPHTPAAPAQAEPGAGRADGPAGPGHAVGAGPGAERARAAQRRDRHPTPRRTSVGTSTGGGRAAAGAVGGWEGRECPGARGAPTRPNTGLPTMPARQTPVQHWWLGHRHAVGTDPGPADPPAPHPLAQLAELVRALQASVQEERNVYRQLIGVMFGVILRPWQARRGVPGGQSGRNLGSAER